ncbi:MAG: transglutaminase family protein [Deltaproteobacteria bacterium]|nr:transglutaminase family protein [Deltaproteobacteria bacterium]
MRLGGISVGTVHTFLAEREGGADFEYSSQTYLRRGDVTTRNHAQARVRLGPERVVETLTAEVFEGEALVRTVTVGRGTVEIISHAHGNRPEKRKCEQVRPSSLAFAAMGPSRTCVPVIEETTGEVGTACGLRTADEVRGTLLGQAFTARMSGKRLERLELPEQGVCFERAENPPVSYAPPDLLGEGIAVEGLADAAEQSRLAFRIRAGRPLDLPSNANQSAQRTADGSLVHWLRRAGSPAQGWVAAKELAERVFEAIPDKRPGPFERIAERVLKEGRGACVAHTEAFLSMAKAGGLKARRTLGLVASEGRLWGHEWVQVEFEGAWYDVDATEGAAPAEAARIAIAVGERADEKAAAQLADLLKTAKVSLERLGR